MAPRQKPGLSEQVVGTPPEFLIAVKHRLTIKAFACDLAATRGVNNVCELCYTSEDDSLSMMIDAWVFRDAWCWLNPPFANIGPWVQRACEAKARGGSIAVLVPAAVGANWWVKWVEEQAAIIPLNGRVTFIGHDAGYPKDVALLLYSKDIVPGYRRAWAWMNDLSDEDKQMAKRRIERVRASKPVKTKTAKGPKPRHAAAKTTAREKVRPIADGRKKKRTPPPEEPADVITGQRLHPELGRVTTFKPNGGTSMEAAPERRKVAEARRIILPDPETSQRALGELAELSFEASEAKDRWEDLKERAKTAKDDFDAINERIAKKIDAYTHGEQLPLFAASNPANLEQREADQAQMEQAGAEAESEAIAEEPTTLVDEPAPEGITEAAGEPQDDAGAVDEGMGLADPVDALAGAGEPARLEEPVF